MTDLIARPTGHQDSAGHGSHRSTAVGHETSAESSTDPSWHDHTAIPVGVRLAIAALSVGAGVIHLGMVPSHAAESTIEGVGFAVFGWLQILAGLAVILRPSARALLGTVAVHLTVVALWVWSRTVGLPVGGHAHVAAKVTAIDLVASMFAVVAALLALLLFVAPGLGRAVGAAGSALGGALASAAIIGTSLVLASPSARNHATAHEHGAAETAAPAAGSSDAAGAAAVASDGHTHGTTGAGVGSGVAGDGSGGSAAAGGGAGGTGAVPTALASDGHSHGVAAVTTTVTPEQRCDLGINPVSYWQETAIAGIDTVTGTHNVAAGHDLAATVAGLQGSAALDDLISKTTEPGAEAKDAQMVVALSKVDDQTYDDWLRWLPTYTAASHTAVSTDDNGGHGGHLGPQPWIAMTDQKQCDALASELARSKAVALRYPHPTDAIAAGYFPVTGFVPGIAAHYMNFKIVDGTFDVDHPEMLLYDGTGDNASIVGLSYYLIHPGDYEPTQGFTGPNDHFHRHIGLCVAGTGVIGDSTTTAEDCAARGGVKQANDGGWMNHVWIVPGCESPWGMFSGASPLLERTLADASGTDGGACAGSGVRSRYDLSPGTVATVKAAEAAATATAP